MAATILAGADMPTINGGTAGFAGVREAAAGSAVVGAKTQTLAVRDSAQQFRFLDELEKGMSAFMSFDLAEIGD
jgi:hypothetical protein